MRKFAKIFIFGWIVACGPVCAIVAAEKPLYENDFERAEVGKVPADFLVLDGGFVVKQAGTNRFLELPGTPLDSFAVQFGSSETADVAVAARINATAKGRRFPTFGIGLNGVAGYRLQVSPAKNLVELYRDQQVKAVATCDWKSGAWTHLRLQVRRTGPQVWQIDGKAWAEGAPEPRRWTLSLAEKEAPMSGRSSVFGSPFSGTPIQFDDLRVERVSAKE